MARIQSALNLSPVHADDGVPRLRTPDVAASHRFPFHLRVHPEKWEINEAGRWELTLERAHLRPGVGGVEGRENDLSSLRDSGLASYWENYGDRRWVLLKSRAQILLDIFPDGVFLDVVDVQVVENERLRRGQITVAAWERIEGGTVVADAAEREAVAGKIAMAVWGLDGPPIACVAETRSKVSRLWSALLETAARRPNPSPAVVLRLGRVARLMDVLHNNQDASRLVSTKYGGSSALEKTARTPLEIFMEGLRTLPAHEQTAALQQWLLLTTAAKMPDPISVSAPPPAPAPAPSPAPPTTGDAPLNSLPPGLPEKPKRRSSPPKDPEAKSPAVGLDNLFT